ncbi:hypothetical protein EJ110_NYTH24571 [Nymphaea thermarum]|nr:hypothetical protein EJ110_NYTH24571 [Nymphaea thermarum]
MERFEKSSHYDFNVQLNNLNQTGSMIEYQHQFEKLACLVDNWNDDAPVGAFIGGVKPEIRLAVQTQPSQVLRECMKVARDKEEKIEMKQQGPLLAFLPRDYRPALSRENSMGMLSYRLSANRKPRKTGNNCKYRQAYAGKQPTTSRLGKEKRTYKEQPKMVEHGSQFLGPQETWLEGVLLIKVDAILPMPVELFASYLANIAPSDPCTRLDLSKEESKWLHIADDSNRLLAPRTSLLDALTRDYGPKRWFKCKGSYSASHLAADVNAEGEAARCQKTDDTDPQPRADAATTSVACGGCPKQSEVTPLTQAVDAEGVKELERSEVIFLA